MRLSQADRDRIDEMEAEAHRWLRLADAARRRKQTAFANAYVQEANACRREVRAIVGDDYDGRE
jgi:hypothetical protein